MVKVEHLAGKLVGIRYTSPVTAPEIEAFSAQLRTTIAPAMHVVFAVDFSDLAVLEGSLADHTTQIMRSDNPKLQKSAFLLPRSSVAALQAERMIRDAGDPRRRSFRSIPSLLEWIDPDLTREEREAARAFFKDRPSGPH